MFVTLFFFTILSLLHAKPLTNHPKTDSRQTSPTTKFLPQGTEAKSSKARANKEPAAPNTIPFPACEHDGKFYLPGERFAEGTDGKGWCYGLYCDNDGHAISWDNFECGTSTPPSTDAISTVPPTLGCEYDGKFYSYGERFAEGNDGQGWCYGMYCSENGETIAWDNFNCGALTQPTTAPTTIPTTFPFPPATSKVTIPPSHTSSPFLPITSKITTPPSHTTSPSLPITSKITTPPSHTSSPFPPITSKITTPPSHTSSPFPPITSKVTTPPSHTSSPFPPITSKITTPPSHPSSPFPPTTSKITTPPSHTSSPFPPTTSKITTAPPPTTTELPSTSTDTTSPTPRLGCEYLGKVYPFGESFAEGNDGQEWCYGMYCTENGDIFAWDNFNCGLSTQPATAPTTPPHTFSPFPPITSKVTTPPPHTSSSLPPTRSEITTPRTTPPHTTFSPTSGQTTPTVPTQPQGCEYEEKFYPPGAEISRSSDGHGWCYGLYCNYDGNTVPWDDFDCGSTTSTPSSTTAPLPTTTEQPSTPTGCMHDGKFYPPGEISRGKSGNWCGGLICQGNGQIVAWDNWNCGTTTPTFATTATSSPTSIPETSTRITTPTTLPTTTLRTSTFESSDESARPSSSPDAPTSGGTSQPNNHGSTIQPTTNASTSPPTSPQSIGWCFFEGQYYENGNIISRIYHGFGWCSGWYCNDGKVASWNDFNCPRPTTELKSTSSVHSSLCYHNGVYYNDGEIVSLSEGSADCEGWYCSGGVLVPYEGTDCGSTPLVRQPETNQETTQANPNFAAPTLPGAATKLPSKGTDQSIKKTNTPTMKTRTTTEKNNPTTNTDQATSEKKSTPLAVSRKLSSLLATSQTIPKPKLCFHNGTYYEEGDIISEDFDGDNWCSGWICKDGQLISVNCNDITNKISKEDISVPKPIVPSTTRGPEPSLCFHEGRFYEEGDVAKTGNDWCSGLICKDSEMVIWDNCEVKVENVDLLITKQTTTPGSTTNPTTQSRDATNSPDTTLPQPNNIVTEATHIPKTPKAELCFYNGTYYEEGDIISEDFDENNWCSGWICKDGQLISVNCSDITNIISKGDTSSPKLVISPTTEGPEPSLCFHEGIFYEEGDLATTENDWCSGLICRDSVMVTWDNCEVKVENADPPITKQTTTPGSKTSPITQSKDTTSIQSPDSTTRIIDTPTKPQQTTPTRSPQTTKLRCYYEGELHPPGEVTRGTLKDGRCYGVVCDISGALIQWVTATCEPTEPPTAEIRNTLPGCVYNDKYYPPGRISRVSDGTGWCLDVMCTEGEIVSINNLQCDKPTTTEPTAATTTTRQNEIKCSYNGMFF